MGTSESSIKTIDFQGIISLDQTLVEQLTLYLQEKESKLSLSIVNAIHPLPRESLPPALPFSTSGQIKLNDAIEAFAKNVHKVSDASKLIVAPDDWRLARSQINNSLWEYVEVLDGCVTELFQQLGQVGFEMWHKDLLSVVQSIKDILSVRLEELGWYVDRLDAILWDYRWVCESRSGKWIAPYKVLYFWRMLLDRSVYSYIRKSRRQLNSHFQNFALRYDNYHKLKKRIDRSLKKFSSYYLFKKLDDTVQKDFKNLYELLKLWSLNDKLKSLPDREPIRALRSSFSMEKTTQLFQTYKKELNQALYQRSRKFKEDPNDLYHDSASRRVVGEVLKSFRKEVHTLGATIERYRDFFLKTHPNPYVRTKWGFSEWVVGPEPVQTRELLDVVYEVELLDKLFEELSESLEKGPSPKDSTELAQLYREVQHTLHEMGQPLTSRASLRSRAEKFLEQIEEMNELGSFQPEVVDYVGKSLSKALRADWQYHVLFDHRKFYLLYQIHQEISGPIDDRHHVMRMGKFEELVKQVHGWVQNRDSHRHVNEIETDMTDMKDYLQDFLASVQRVSQDDSIEKSVKKRAASEISRQLLQYRFLFGKFFHDLHQHETEGKMIRNQFLFVDQYFEAVEAKLQDMG